MLPAPIVCREPTDSRSSGLRLQPSRRNGSVFEEFRELHTSGVVLAAKGVKTYVVGAAKTQNQYLVRHDEPVVQLC